MSSGRWDQLGVPHKGWSCISVEDLEEPSHLCEMCRIQHARYVHWMSHPDYGELLGVGCVCAEKMENDYASAKTRERNLKNAASRRSRWLSRNWKTSNKGNSYLNTDGYNIVIYKTGGKWGHRITHRESNKSQGFSRVYITEDQAKLAAFDALVFLKNL